MPPVKFSFAISLVISFGFLLITFWIFYKYSWSAEAAKDALSTTGSYYGAAATLGAAIIAAYLFNDWRAQHNKTVEKDAALDVIEKFDIVDLHLSKFKDDIFSLKNKLNHIYEMSDSEFEGLSKELKNIISSLNGVYLEFGSYMESLRKYSIISDVSHFENNKNELRKTSLKILGIQNIGTTTLFTALDDIDTMNSDLSTHIKSIEDNIQNIILKELKALT